MLFARFRLQRSRLAEDRGFGNQWYFSLEEPPLKESFVGLHCRMQRTEGNMGGQKHSKDESQPNMRYPSGVSQVDRQKRGSRV